MCAWVALSVSGADTANSRHHDAEVHARMVAEALVQPYEGDSGFCATSHPRADQGVAHGGPSNDGI